MTRKRPGAGVKPLYNFYENSVEDPVPYEIYRDVVCDFNQMVIEDIINNASVLHLGKGLGALSVVRVKRGKKGRSAKAIDWGESNKNKQAILDAGEVPYSKDNPEGKKWFVYFTNPTHVKFHWTKKRCKIKGKIAFRFRATRGNNSAKSKLKNKLNAHEGADRFYPILGRPGGLNGL